MQYLDLQVYELCLPAMSFLGVVQHKSVYLMRLATCQYNTACRLGITVRQLVYDGEEALDEAQRRLHSSVS